MHFFTRSATFTAFAARTAVSSPRKRGPSFTAVAEREAFHVDSRWHGNDTATFVDGREVHWAEEGAVPPTADAYWQFGA